MSVLPIRFDVHLCGSCALDTGASDKRKLERIARQAVMECIDAQVYPPGREPEENTQGP